MTDTIDLDDEVAGFLDELLNREAESIAEAFRWNEAHGSTHEVLACLDNDLTIISRLRRLTGLGMGKSPI